jgi:hypothetical protein
MIITLGVPPDVAMYSMASVEMAFLFKGIVSRDLEVCFLVPFDSSDIATPDRMGPFFFKVDFVSDV